ncbi:MAG: hypothetical protein AAGG08_15720 [Actinomycetota bacterium]
MIDVRSDLLDAQAAAWRDIAAPGSWWSGAQRLRIASIARAALDDPEPIPPWVSAVGQGRAVDDGLIPTVAADVTYRIARHAGTITEEVARSVTAEIGALAYVELCSIVSAVAAIDRFHRNVGNDVPDLPDPVAGEPTREQPAEVVDATLNWVPVAAPADQTAAVLQAYSAVPGAQRMTWRLGAAQYMPAEEMIHADWMRRADGLTRPEAELIASRVAQLRECFY